MDTHGSHKYSSYSMWRAAPAGIVAHIGISINSLKQWLWSLASQRPQLADCSGMRVIGDTQRTAAPVEVSRTMILTSKPVDQFQQGYTMAAEELYSNEKPYAAKDYVDAIHQQPKEQPGQLQSDIDREISTTLDFLDTATYRGHKFTKSKHTRAD
jgi:hypothetical protein